MNHTDRELVQRWISGIPYEVAFWRSYYGNRRRRRDLFGWSLYGRECDTENFDMQAFMSSMRREEADPLVLDVGCALSYAFGNIADGKPMRVEYVDPLAPFYNEILDRYGIERPRISFGMAETLSASYAEGSVCFVHIRNALDHSADPATAIVEAIRVLRRGGVLYCNHFRNEAEREGYRGFHQFNIDEEDGHMILWNRGMRVDVNRMTEGFAEVEVSRTAGGRIVAVLRKTSEVPRGTSGASAGARASEMLMATVCHFHSAGRSAAYQFKRLYCTAGHRMMRLMPWAVLDKVKAWAGRKQK